MKLWIDDVRPAPEGYTWCKSVEEAKNTICDRCGAHSPYADSHNEALNNAKEAGWLHIVEGNKDYCPDCRKEIK